MMLISCKLIRKKCPSREELRGKRQRAYAIKSLSLFEAKPKSIQVLEYTRLYTKNFFLVLHIA